MLTEKTFPQTAIIVSSLHVRFTEMMVMPAAANRPTADQKSI